MPQQPPPTSHGTPPTSEPALSEVARELVLPVGIVSTAWPAVRDKLRTLGVRFQRWQDGAGRCILSKRDDGLYSAGIGGAFLSVPRQSGKTFLIGWIVFALCLLRPGLIVLWTAHRKTTSKETFRTMSDMARKPKVKPYIAPRGIQRAGDNFGIEFRNGSRIMFGARENEFGRGMPGVGMVVFDEAQILKQDDIDAMVPTTNQGENPLIVYMGTPPKPTDPSEVFTRNRTRALAGESENVLWIEFGADPKTDPTNWPKGYVDWQQVAKANPSFPRWTPRHAILRLIEQLGLASFKLEGLGIWPDASGPKPTISKAQWGGRKVDTPPPGGGVAIGIKFSRDGDRVAAAAARKPDGHGPHVEALGEWPTAEGIALLETLLTAQWRKLAAIVVDGQAGRDVLLADLKRARIPARILIAPTVPQVIAANATFLTAVEDSTLTHANQPGLNASVATATKRAIGTSGGFGWEAIGDGDEVPTEAAALAVWAASNARRPASMPRSF